MMDAPEQGLHYYLVGGAVRDHLLNLPVHEHDYVVVGSTAEAMRTRGFRQVGKSFPVFLHPITQQEYALARLERKVSPGYHGFTVHAHPDVTLEQDLARRDLTINAIAQAPDGQLIDPFGGQADLEQRWLRHVSPAFTEDPVRILRVARFAARFAPFGFRVAPETVQLMRTMVTSGEIDALVPERIWQEVVRALETAQPRQFFQVLRTCGALERLLPELARLWGIPQPRRWHPEIDTGEHVMLTLEMAAQLNAPPEVRFAVLCHDFGKGTTPVDILPSHHGHEQRSADFVAQLCQRWRIPKRFCELADLVARYHGYAHKVYELRPGTILKVLNKLDPWRRSERFHAFLIACEADYRGRLNYTDKAYPQKDCWQQYATACAALDHQTLIQNAATPAHIPALINQARLAQIRHVQRHQLPS
jgi:tRNA nucleotidyltransferase (CCA-adding enzyme)